MVLSFTGGGGEGSWTFLDIGVNFYFRYSPDCSKCKRYVLLHKKFKIDSNDIFKDRQTDRQTDKKKERKKERKEERKEGRKKERKKEERKEGRTCSIFLRGRGGGTRHPTITFFLNGSGMDSLR